MIKNKKFKKQIKKRKKIYNYSNNIKNIPRLSVFRSNKYIYVQIINDYIGKTIISASSIQKKIKKKLKKTNDINAAMYIGNIIAKKAIKLNIKKVVFDRNGFKYHGKIKALANAARKKGLKF